MYMVVKDTKKETIKSLIDFSSLGLEMGLSVAIGLGMGYFLDRFFKTYPYLTIIFTCFGIGAAFKTIIVLIKKMKKENERNNNQ
ncbi:MAG TPA: AtpZ/AtpI family protein [Syntrophorhabdaceae bacterium]|nr:AtpZ/AtpI family protein [Syntrophorhabdaceae bacterium]HPP05870.1 AtpZ/AtpI family protein [Syntrophorhabdaceae bacterium]